MPYLLPLSYRTNGCKITGSRFDYSCLRQVVLLFPRKLATEVSPRKNRKNHSTGSRRMSIDKYLISISVANFNTYLSFRKLQWKVVMNLTFRCPKTDATIHNMSTIHFNPAKVPWLPRFMSQSHYTTKWLKNLGMNMNSTHHTGHLVNLSAHIQIAQNCGTWSRLKYILHWKLWNHFNK